MTENQILSEQQLIKAQFYRSEKDASKTFSYLEKSLAADPGNFEAWMEMAMLHEHKGNIPEDINCAEKAVDNGYYDYEPYEKLTRYYNLIGDNINAIKCSISMILFESEKHEHYDNLAYISQRFSYKRKKTANPDEAIDICSMIYDDDVLESLLNLKDCLSDYSDNQEIYDQIEIISKQHSDKLKKAEKADKKA